MKFFIKKKKIIKLLGKLNSCITINFKNPILSNILLLLKENCLYLTVTNLDIEINYNIILPKNSILEVGEITVNIRKFYDLCNTFSDESNLLIDVNNNLNLIRIICEKSILTLSGLSTKHFPLLEKNNLIFRYKFVFSINLLRNIIYNISFSISNNDIHNYLNGLLVEFYNNFFFFVTTDSYRLSIYKTADYSYLNIKNYNFNFILSRKLVLALYKFLDFIKIDSNIIFEVNKNLAKITFDNFVIYSSLIDGIFPDYKNILLMTKLYNYLIIDIKSFKSALLRSAIISSYTYSYVTLTFDKHCLKIYSNNSFSDEIIEKIYINYKGKKFKVHLNVKFILDVLNVVKNSSLIRFYFHKHNSVIKINDNKNLNILYIIMPLKL